MPSEFEFIQRIRQQAAKQALPAGDLVFGIGDDAAIWREQTGCETLITVDLLVEDVDFKLEYAPPRWLGHKALAVSLSDIAAMGGMPKYALLTLAIPKLNPQSEDFWEEFFAGYFALAETYGVQLIGGDISSAPDRLTVDSIVIGHCQTGRAVRRNGAKARDAIYVTGSVGGSAAGLKHLLNGARIGDDVCSSAFRRPMLASEQPPEGGTTNAIQSAIRAHLKPEPQVEFGRRLGELGLANSMIDISDGLAQDLAHICEDSGVSAMVDFDAVPIAKEVSYVAATLDEAFELAVSGGEDFELLFTADPKNEAALMEIGANCQLRLTRIGIVFTASQSPSLQLRRGGSVQPLSIRGYDHFTAH
jgi:thiamine-monophosphate kinase